MPLFSGRTILGVVACLALILGGFVLRDVEYPGVDVDVELPWVSDGCDGAQSYRKSLLEASTQHMRRINDLQEQAAAAYVAGDAGTGAARLQDVSKEADSLAADLARIDIVVEKREQRDAAVAAARGIGAAARGVATADPTFDAASFEEASAPLDAAAQRYNDAMQELVDTSPNCD
jgi:hypothetical protein